MAGFLGDQRKIELYKEFTREDFDTLQKKFNLNNFLGTWKQVFTSRSTGLLGTGTALTNVQATYTLKENGLVNVFNSSLKTDLTCNTISGESGALNDQIPCCRYVQFDNIVQAKGDYWLTYINDDFSVIVVVAPIIVLGLQLSNNFGFYALTKDRDQFWNNKTEIDKLLAYLKSKGFDKFWNEPVPSGTSITKDCSV